MFEITIDVFTLIGFLFCLFILFCLCCLVGFVTIMSWEFTRKHRKNRYARHQSSGELEGVKKEHANFLTELEAAEKRAGLHNTAYPVLRVPQPPQKWEHEDRRFSDQDIVDFRNRVNPDEPPTQIYPFNMTGQEVIDATHPLFKNR